ncbi:MAG: DUF488 domain-containing protein [Methylobacterium sp.]|nr:DUF488 domain-containing protein [Methylobacterium sp.]
MSDAPAAPEVLTVGHSNHPIDRFFDLVAGHGVNALVDVRTSPFSRFAPQFNREALAASARERGLAYVFLGRELGGRPSDPRLVDANGVADYVGMARTAEFADGIARVMQGLGKGYRIALTCSERCPTECHRCLLVARQIGAEGVRTAHILFDGRREEQVETEARILTLAGKSASLFEDAGSVLDEAYAKRARMVAWRRPPPQS